MITPHHVHTCHELVGCAWPARVMRPRQAGIDPGCWCPGGLVRAQEISDRLQIYLKTSSALYQYHGVAVATSCTVRVLIGAVFNRRITISVASKHV